MNISEEELNLAANTVVGYEQHIDKTMLAESASAESINHVDEKDVFSQILLEHLSTPDKKK